MLSVHALILAIWYFRGWDAMWTVYESYGLRWDGVAAGGIWQLVTHMWLHGGWEHLILNALLFYYAAARLSHVLSGRRITTLFLLTGFGSGAVHVLAQAIFPALPSAPLVGASGGIFGMLLGFFTLSPDSRMLFLPVSARNLAKGIIVSSLLLFLMTPGLGVPLFSTVGRWLESGFGAALFNVAHLAHFTGGLLGWVFIGRFFPPLLTSQDLAEMRAKREKGELAKESGSVRTGG